MLRWRFSVLLGLLWCVLLSTPSHALPVFAPRQLPSAMAGATDPSVAAIVYNPAALGLLRGRSFYFEGGLRVGTLDVKLDGFESQKARYVSPDGFVGLTANLGDRVTLAIATHMPLTDVARLPQGLSRFAERNDFVVLQETIAVGFRVSNRFTIGASFSIAEAWGDLRFDRDVAPSGGSALIDQPSELCGQAACGYNNPLARQKLAGSGFRWGLGFGVGILGRPIDGLWLAINYQSRIFNGASSGDLTLFDYRGAGATPAPGQKVDCASGGGRCRGNARLQMPIPNLLSVAARVMLPRTLELELGFRWINYGANPTREVLLQGGTLDNLAQPTAAALPVRFLFDRGLQDAFLASVALRVDVMRRFRLQPYLAYESPAVARSRNQPASLDGHKVDLSLVFEAKLTNRVHLTGHVGVTAHALGRIDSAFSSQHETTCVDGGYALSACLDRVGGRAWPSASGAYVFVVPHVGLGFDIAF